MEGGGGGVGGAIIPGRRLIEGRTAIIQGGTYELRCGQSFSK